MFEQIQIKLTGPICTCAEQNLSWSVSLNSQGWQASLTIACKICKTELRVPHEKFKAAFMLATPYPGKPKPDLEADRKMDGNVVQLYPDKQKS